MDPNVVALLKAAEDVAVTHAPSPSIRRLLAAAAIVRAEAEAVMHLKTKGTYFLGPVIELQVSTPGFFFEKDGLKQPIEGMTVQAYASERCPSKVWGRFVPEMWDGRFVRLPETGEVRAA